ncbi:uncharacterized protein LOC129598349 [Paramacrobiotus metropolitanus]|uniref:uncharacterized protein LOC129598349 n=1 Tax=Paramacrobiotus metropolitanus TaxID=2943436 RepID=UPI0024463E1C|nr:uncharacterized protein LOC129598349 [Paramacrobiotus metropolitanus]
MSAVTRSLTRNHGWLLLAFLQLLIGVRLVAGLQGPGEDVAAGAAEQLMSSSFLALPGMKPTAPASKPLLQYLTAADAQEKLVRFERSCELMCSVYPESAKCLRCKNRAPLRYGKRAVPVAPPTVPTGVRGGMAPEDADQLTMQDVLQANAPFFRPFADNPTRGGAAQWPNRR